jgi:hypothetical protein
MRSIIAPALALLLACTLPALAQEVTIERREGPPVRGRLQRFAVGGLQVMRCHARDYLIPYPGAKEPTQKRGAQPRGSG